MSFLVFIACFAFTTNLAHGASTDNCKNFELVSRESWGSKVSLPTETMPPPRRVIIHHTKYTGECNAISECSAIIRQLQKTQIDVLEEKDLNFNFVIGGDGKVYEGLGWKTPGLHTYGYSRSLGIAFIGDYDEKEPSAEMMNALKELVLCGVQKGHLNENAVILGHSDTTCTTSCPGGKLQDLLKKLSLYGGPLTKDCPQ